MAMETSQCLICASQHNLQWLYEQIHIAPARKVITKTISLDGLKLIGIARYLHKCWGTDFVASAIFEQLCKYWLSSPIVIAAPKCTMLRILNCDPFPGWNEKNKRINVWVDLQPMKGHLQNGCITITCNAQQLDWLTQMRYYHLMLTFDRLIRAFLELLPVLRLPPLAIHYIGIVSLLSYLSFWNW